MLFGGEKVFVTPHRDLGSHHTVDDSCFMIEISKITMKSDEKKTIPSPNSGHCKEVQELESQLAKINSSSCHFSKDAQKKPTGALVSLMFDVRCRQPHRLG